MCAPARRGPVAAGPYATIEETEAESDSKSGIYVLRLTIDVPFELQSISEAQIDISSTSVLLQGPETVSGVAEVRIQVPEGFALDPEHAAAKYSRKKRQFTITSPNVARERESADAPSSPSTPKTVEPLAVDAARASPASPASVPKLTQASQAPSASTVVEASTASEPVSVQSGSRPAPDDDDDDDLPPALEASRSVPRKVAETAAAVSSLKTDSATVAADDGGEKNEVAEAMMQKALAARELKKQETEEARRSADLAASGGLKKGFLSGGKAAKRRPAAKQGDTAKVDEVPFITGMGDSAEAARRESLKLPEVQQALRQGMSKLQEDKSWVTPTLLQVFQSRPDLMTAMSNPRVQEAISLMQKDPDEAKRKYSNDPEITGFLKEFSSLMATHFDLLGKEAPAPASPAAAGAAPPQKALPKAPVTPFAPDPVPQAQQPLPIADPKVAAAFQDPEVQELLASLRAGRPLEMHELFQQRPRLFEKVKVLLDAGLLSMQQ
mmetsp:Transcript_49563/g.106066  ORF Transcript_49563/g.106066 Transcript_49563/m.106066 type:complete len:497 (+) Transcript_49563:54-1544(+)